ncbi:MAG: flagellar motor switch protein FliN [Gemmataceae bacterium]
MATSTMIPPDAAHAARPEIEARVPEFADLGPAAANAPAGSLENLLDVTCTVTAELGRTRLAIADVLKLNVGSIVELDRLVSQPVDILVQGVLLARGEVVVVNDRFAIRIQEIIDARKR